MAFLATVQLLATVLLALPIAMYDPAHAPFLSWSGYLARYAGLVLAVSIAWFGWQMFWHIETIRKSLDFRFVDATEEPRLCRVIEPLIVMMGLPPPFLGVIESPSCNAFACGLGPSKAVVVVTRGLVDGLSDVELGAVLAHELSHIKHGDIRLMAAANILMQALNKMHEGNPMRFTPVHIVLSIAVPAILPLALAGGFMAHLALRAGQVARLMISSSREYIADAEAALLTKNPGALAAALIKVENDYRIDGARTEDDAMMIAGDTTGTGATHPTVTQRIAALSRVTGSMVFNSPDSPSQAAWVGSTTLAAAEQAAVSRRLPAARLLAQVRAGSPENWLGLTPWRTVALFATVVALGWIHHGELNNSRAMAATFDIRPVGLLLGGPISCEHFSPMQGLASCESNLTLDSYRDFEGQQNTLAGWLAEMNREQRQRGVATSPMEQTFSRIGPADQTGLATVPATANADSSGNSTVATDHAAAAVPTSALLAEMQQFGCFPPELLRGDRVGEGVPDSYTSVPDDSLEHYLSQANISLVAYGRPGTSDNDDWLRRYAEQRASLLNGAYKRFGSPGLALLATAYSAQPHQKVVSAIAARLMNPQFNGKLDGIERAKMTALVRSPETFLPCTARAGMGQ